MNPGKGERTSQMDRQPNPNPVPNSMSAQYPVDVDEEITVLD